jgi:hypothetical protein
MSRAKLLAVPCATLLLALPAAGDRAVPPTGVPRPESGLFGTWAVTFANGVAETCEVRPDGTASESEPQRSADGKVEASGSALVITFEDGRVERWNLISGRVVVEHWSPAAAYPAGAAVVGVADRVR